MFVHIFCVGMVSNSFILIALGSIVLSIDDFAIFKSFVVSKEQNSLVVPNV